MGPWIFIGILAAAVLYIDTRSKEEYAPEIPEGKVLLSEAAAGRYAQMLWGNLQVELQDIPLWDNLDPSLKTAFTKIAIQAANQNRAVTYNEIEIILNSAREGA